MEQCVYHHDLSFICINTKSLHDNCFPESNYWLDVFWVWLESNCDFAYASLRANISTKLVPSFDHVPFSRSKPNVLKDVKGWFHYGRFVPNRLSRLPPRCCSVKWTMTLILPRRLPLGKSNVFGPRIRFALNLARPSFMWEQNFLKLFLHLFLVTRRCERFFFFLGKTVDGKLKPKKRLIDVTTHHWMALEKRTNDQIKIHTHLEGEKTRSKGHQ